MNNKTFFTKKNKTGAVSNMDLVHKGGNPNNQTPPVLSSKYMNVFGEVQDAEAVEKAVTDPNEVSTTVSTEQSKPAEFAATEVEVNKFTFKHIATTAFVLLGIYGGLKIFKVI